MIRIELRKPGYALLASVCLWLLFILAAVYLTGCTGSNAARAAVGLPPSLSTVQQVCPPNDSGTYPTCTPCPTGATATTTACVCPVNTTLDTAQNQCATNASGSAPPTTTSGTGSNTGSLGNAPPTTAPIAGAPACPTGGTPDPSTSECVYPPTAGTGSSSGSGTGTPTAPTPPAPPVSPGGSNAQVWLAVPTVGVDQFTGAPTLSWQDSDLIAACTVTAPGNYSSGPYPADGGGYPYVLDPLPTFPSYTVTCVDPSGSTLTGTATI